MTFGSGMNATPRSTTSKEYRLSIVRVVEVQSQSARLSMTIARPSVTSRTFSSRPWPGRLDDEALQHVAQREEDRHQHEDRDVGIDAAERVEKERRVQRQHEQAAVREVDDVQHAIDQRQAERDERVDRAHRQPVQHGRKQQPAIEHAALARLIVALSRLSGIGKTAFADANSCRIDDLDIALQDLRIGRLRALVLSVDELGRAIGHDVIAVGRGRERLVDLGAVGALARSSASASTRMQE